MHDNDDGVRWLMARTGTRRIDPVAASRGRLQFTGEYWQGRVIGECWGPIETARYFTTEERDMNPHWPAGHGGEWVAVLVNVPAVTE